MISLPSITCVQNWQFKDLSESVNEMDFYSFTEKIQNNRGDAALLFVFYALVSSWWTRGQAEFVYACPETSGF